MSWWIAVVGTTIAICAIFFIIIRFIKWKEESIRCPICDEVRSIHNNNQPINSCPNCGYYEDDYGDD